jgi:hypothetical protein
MYAIMALAATTAMTSCEDEDLKKVYTEGVSLDSPYIFSEGYQDEIVHPYDLSTPITDRNVNIKITLLIFLPFNY